MNNVALRFFPNEMRQSHKLKDTSRGKCHGAASGISPRHTKESKSLRAQRPDVVAGASGWCIQAESRQRDVRGFTVLFWIFTEDVLIEGVGLKPSMCCRQSRQP
ncbi:hypothetical protein BaRGS_00014429 [Batillaria attramentaria]|uniref:Uncharacterized protein n=1 Tax=Batillaria attramentaria TaxID=370345 RepID=A0ABD0L4V5_9CAEN